MLINTKTARFIGTCVGLFVFSACTSTSNAQNFDPIPHSTVATAAGKGINTATLSCPTNRYAHGVLGDTIEAGCLAVEVDDGKMLVFQLPEQFVFEDLVPHIADYDADGANDVAVVRSGAAAGAALVLYTVSNEDELVELAATPAIGRGNRWLAPIGVADFDGDNKLDIAYVQTPHIGGILKVWTMNNGSLNQIAELRGFSNHSIGSTRVSTSKILDYNDDGVMDIALPDQRRRMTVWLTLSPELQVLDQQPFNEAYFD